MRRLRGVLGWIVTIVLVTAYIGGLVAVLVGAEFVNARLPATDPRYNWIGVLIAIVLFGGVAALGLYVLFSPKARQARRLARAERAERRRKLDNFEL